MCEADLTADDTCETDRCEGANEDAGVRPTSTDGGLGNECDEGDRLCAVFVNASCSPLLGSRERSRDLTKLGTEDAPEAARDCVV